MRSYATRTTAALAVACVFAGCGSAANEGAGASGSLGTCAATVLHTLGHVAMHVYHEGIASERTQIALRGIVASSALRNAVERDDPVAARAAAREVIAAGRLTDLLVKRGGTVLADVGVRHAVTPLAGNLTGANGRPIATYLTTVWSDEGLLAETGHLTESIALIRAGGRRVSGPVGFPLGELRAREGTVTVKRVVYQYTSFPAQAFPSGPARVYLLRPVSSTSHLCGATDQDTLVNTLARVATSIYAREGRGHAAVQIRRVAQDPTLLRAVALRDPRATQQAIVGVLNQHVVRLRVSAGGRLLSDVGGPFVLAPVRAALHLGGREIGTFVLSIQDDEGYLRLVKRLAGLDVLMYMGQRLVKNDVGRVHGAVPRRGSFRLHGHVFRTFTFTAKAFPAGPLRITVVIPIPYS
jgi:hypothetical protein